MKISARADRVKLEQEMVLAVDCHKGELTCYGEFCRDGHVHVVEDTTANRSNGIQGMLRQFQRVATESGLRGIHVVCEPSGGWERQLLRVAHRLGCTTSYVNGESVSKLRVVESNDSGKTDRKDPRVIHLAARNGRLLQTRDLPPAYRHLHALNGAYEEEDRLVVEVKNLFYGYLMRLFPDLRLKPKAFWTPVGHALVEAFGCNPHRIVACGYERFVKRMRKAAGRVREKTLDRIWDDAEVGVLHTCEEEDTAVMQRRIRELYADYERHQGRKTAMRAEMCAVWRALPESVALKAIPDVGEFLMARLMGATGPLCDFRRSRQLLRYAGLNLREHSSGKYTGKVKISKKGRSLIRKILYQMALSVISKAGRLFRSFYIRKHLDLGAGKKAMVAVMRKLLEMIFGLSRSDRAFERKRVFCDESQYGRAA
jgi:transposase